MRKSRFTEEQIIGILQEVAAGAEARAVCRRVGITEQTFYRWRQKYGDMQVSDARRLKQLEDENRQLKRIVADQALNLQALRDVLGNGSRRRGSGATSSKGSKPQQVSASAGRFGSLGSLARRCGTEAFESRRMRLEHGSERWPISGSAGATG
jgi:putative transposase